MSHLPKVLESLEHKITIPEHSKAQVERSLELYEMSNHVCVQWVSLIPNLEFILPKHIKLFLSLMLVVGCIVQEQTPEERGIQRTNMEN